MRALMIVSLMLLAQPGFCGWLWWGSKAESAWTPKTIEVDGSEAAWKNRDLDDDAGLSFSFSNDDQNLYFFVRPHTTWTKDQMQGVYGQSLTLWLDGSGGTRKATAVRLLKPAHDMAGGPRELELVGVDTMTIFAQPEAMVGPIDERGGLEARIPLVYFGSRLPERVSVGVIASRPEHLPEKKKRPVAEGDSSGGGKGGGEGGGGSEQGGGGSGGRRGGKGGRGGGKPPPMEESYDSIELWIRVKLAKAPTP